MSQKVERQESLTAHKEVHTPVTELHTETNLKFAGILWR
jgi:hypothetical protein